MPLQQLNLGKWAQQGNVGYLTHLMLIDIKSVVGEVEPFTSWMVRQEDLPLATTTTVVNFRFPFKSCAFSESRADSPDGTAYQAGISATIPRNYYELIEWLYVNQDRRWLVVARDVSGMVYLFGDHQNGLRLGWQRSVASSNSVTMSLEGVNWHPAYFLDNLLTIDSAAPLPQGVTINVMDKFNLLATGRFWWQNAGTYKLVLRTEKYDVSGVAPVMTGIVWTLVDGTPVSPSSADLYPVAPPDILTDQLLTVDDVVRQLTVPAGANYAFLQVQDADVRYSASGTTPSPTVGTLLKVDEPVEILSRQELLSAKFIRAGSTNAKVYVQYYKQYQADA